VDVDVVEGFVEVEGIYPILVTATHGFGTDSFKYVVKALRRYVKSFGLMKTIDRVDEVLRLLNYYSSVDLYTWEIAYKVAVAENIYAVLPTLSKVDKVPQLSIPDYNLNKGYTKATPFWERVEEVVRGRGIRVLIDIHGMSNRNRWPDICISTRGFSTTSKELISRIISYLVSQRLRVAIDYPFTGGAFIAYFGNPPFVEAFAIEIKKNLRFFGSEIPKIIRGIIKIVKDYLKLTIS
jgi:hypothetical protein